MEISVIMGVYNPARPEHLIQAVQSIVRQSFPHWEMLLYDDGSGPNYAGAIQAAAKLDSRIRYLRGEENRGLAHALNRCIAHARGKYLARMDADDIAWPERFARQHQFLETHPQYQWVGSTARLMDESGIWGLETVAEIPRPGIFCPIPPISTPLSCSAGGLWGKATGKRGASVFVRTTSCLCGCINRGAWDTISKPRCWTTARMLAPTKSAPWGGGCGKRGCGTRASVP